MAKVISERWRLLGADIYSVLKGALLAGLGAGAVYGIEALKLMDFGEYNMIVAAVCAVLLNLIRKFVTEKEY